MTLVRRIENYKYNEKPLSNHVLKRSIRAMEELISQYEDTDYDFAALLCSLCSIGGCEKCPWHVLTECGCTKNAELVVYEGRAKQRIRQLRRWIAAYVAVLMDR